MGEQRAKRFMLVLLGLQRLNYLAPSLMGQFGAGITKDKFSFVRRQAR